MVLPSSPIDKAYYLAGQNTFTVYQTSTFDSSVLNLIPNWAVNMDLIQPPNVDEVRRAVNQMASSKAPGVDGLPADVFKAGSQNLTMLTHLFQNIWNKRSVPQEFRDALIVHIFKRKGDRSVCDDHRGISLLSIPGKIPGQVILNRLSKHVDEISILPESQCGFRAGRSTMDMIFTARQLQEKCWEQQCEMYAVFADLPKAFNSVDRQNYSLGNSAQDRLPHRLCHHHPLLP